jgi:DNA replication licensing factor MCM4
MEQQTVSIAKAGIIASLNARTSILASANPLESRYNPNLSVVENIKLPPTILSRFDLIYLILDSPNVEQDRQLAQHLVGLYCDTRVPAKPPLDTELLREYIDYAKDKIHPLISDEAAEQLQTSYLELRNPPGGGVPGSRTISATPRQLESLIRTSEALAKMRFSNEVTRADANEALRLLKVATQAAATDPRTGRIDMDMINTGRTSVEREMEENIYLGLKEFLAEVNKSRRSMCSVCINGQYGSTHTLLLQF